MTFGNVIAILAVCSVACTAKASSILGFAIVGGTSHQASIAHMGIELMKRGHNFTLLLSSEDEVSQALLARESFRAIRKIKFSGPSWIGSWDWLRSIPRDPQKAGSLCVTTCAKDAFLADACCFKPLKQATSIFQVCIVQAGCSTSQRQQHSQHKNVSFDHCPAWVSIARLALHLAITAQILERLSTLAILPTFFSCTAIKDVLSSLVSRSRASYPPTAR